MKAELVCLLVACTVVVQGRSLDTSQLKRNLLLKSLLGLPGHGRQKPIEQTFAGGVNTGIVNPNDAGTTTGAIEKIQQLLAMMIESLEPLKGRSEETDQPGNPEDVQKEIDNLALEVIKIESKLNSFPAEEVQESVMNLLYQLYGIYGEKFFMSVWEIYDNLGPDGVTETPIIAEENSETGNDITNPKPTEQLFEIANQVKTIGTMVDQLANGAWESDRMIQAIMTALDSVSSATTTEKPESTTSMATGTENSTTTGTPPSTTTQNILVRGEQISQRRLTNLLKKILESKTI